LSPKSSKRRRRKGTSFIQAQHLNLAKGKQQKKQQWSSGVNKKKKTEERKQRHLHVSDRFFSNTQQLAAMHEEVAGDYRRWLHPKNGNCRGGMH